MCGIAAFLSDSLPEPYLEKVKSQLQHRGRDGNGIYIAEGITLLHQRLSILELTEAGAQPMASKTGRYTISYNGEIYNHKELRARFLSRYKFNGSSDTETILALFEHIGAEMLQHLTGMWAIAIWDNVAKMLFISRDRFGQKPLYYTRRDNVWHFSSEIKPLLKESNNAEEPGLADFLAHGNYGHLPGLTFFNDVNQLLPGTYAWVSNNEDHIQQKHFWQIPQINEKDKVPFSPTKQKELHNAMVEAVLSQTLSDVPIGVTLSGGIDSSIIAGILATYYDKEINLFTAQVPDSHYDESRYVDAVIAKYNSRFIVHRANLHTISIKAEVEKYISIQEEPFGDPSIIAHGSLMKMAHDENIKVILGGQGADEILFGYTNMLPAVLIQQVYSMQLNRFFKNMRSYSGNMNSGLFDMKQFIRIGLQSVSPSLERSLRVRARRSRAESLLSEAYSPSALYIVPSYRKPYDVLHESICHIHLPHLVHYDDRNAMHYGIEGRMPFLDHRIIEQLSQIKTVDFYKNGHRKHLIRESCAAYLPQSILTRKDKVGFYTPLVEMLYRDAAWIRAEINDFNLFNVKVKDNLLRSLDERSLNLQDGLYIWRALLSALWAKKFNIQNIL